jgi:predicted ester cyclase
MSTEDNKAVIRRWNEEIFNEKRIDRADELVTQDYVDHAALPGQAPGLEGAKQKWAMYGAAIPDLRVTMDEMVAEGDRVAARWTAEGTHQGELLGVPPTGNASAGAASASAAWPRGSWRSSSSAGTGWTSCSNWALSRHAGGGQSRAIDAWQSTQGT